MGCLHPIGQENFFGRSGRMDREMSANKNSVGYDEISKL